MTTLRNADDARSTPASSGRPRLRAMADTAGVETCTIGGWEICVTNHGMSSSASEDALSASLGLKLPTMVFPSSSLTLTRPTGGPLSLSFCAADALADVGPADPGVRVRAASAWEGKSERTDVAVSKLEDGGGDWTFTTGYAGTLKNASESEGETTQEIEYEMLKDTSVPIRFFGETVLFEDELDDNGVASYKVRIVRFVTRLLPSNVRVVPD